MSKLLDELHEIFGFGEDSVTKRHGYKKRKEERRLKAAERAKLNAIAKLVGKRKANTAVAILLPDDSKEKKVNLTDNQVDLYKEYRSVVTDGQRRYEVTKLLNNNNNKDSKDTDDKYGLDDFSEWDRWAGLYL